MGNLVVLSDAPATTTGAPEMDRFIDRPYGRVIGEFTRSEVAPDVDVYDTYTLAANQDVYVALFPSFLIFDEMFDKGNVTIEVLDSAGNPYNYTELPLSDTAEALALIQFRSAPTASKFYYRVTPGSGLEHGEYALVDGGQLDFIGRRLVDYPEAGDFYEQALRRELQIVLDGETFPPAFDVYNAYTQADPSNRYSDLSIGGAPFSTTARTVRLGYVAGGSAIDFAVTSGSTASHVQRVLINDDAQILETTNLTLVNGDVNFQLATTEFTVGIMVLKFEESTSVQVTAKHVGAESNIGTFSCVQKINCPRQTVTIPTPNGLASEGELFTVELSMAGDVNAVNEAVPIVDTSTAADYGDFRVNGNCQNSFRDAGVFFARTTSEGVIQVDIDPTNQVQNCRPDLVIKMQTADVNEYLGVGDILTEFENSTRPECEGDSCASGSLSFTGANGLSTVSNLTMLVQGFSGSRLTLSLDSEVFYNETFSESCTNDPLVLHGLSLPQLSGSKDPLAIQYEIEGSAICTDRQKLVLGFLGFNEETASPTSSPTTPSPTSSPVVSTGSIVGDDTPLIAGLSSAAVLVVLGAFAFIFYYKFSPKTGHEAKEEAITAKEDV